jgi:hypothetical protein
LSAAASALGLLSNLEMILKGNLEIDLKAALYISVITQLLAVYDFANLFDLDPYSAYVLRRRRGWWH